MNINLTILGQSISFAIFVWFCMKFIWPPIIAVLRERREQIGRGLEQAEQANQQLAAAEKEAENTLATAKKSAQAIIEQSHSRADQIVEQAKQQAVIEGEQLKEAAQADIERQTNQAREKLRGRVVDLVVQGVEKVLQESVNQKKHSGMLKNLASEL